MVGGNIYQLKQVGIMTTDLEVKVDPESSKAIDKGTQENYSVILLNDDVTAMDFTEYEVKIFRHTETAKDP